MIKINLMPEDYFKKVKFLNDLLVSAHDAKSPLGGAELTRSPLVDRTVRRPQFSSGCKVDLVAPLCLASL